MVPLILPTVPKETRSSRAARKAHSEEADIAASIQALDVPASSPPRGLARPRRGPFKLKVPAHADMNALRAVLVANSGPRTVIITMVLPDGSEADLETGLKVTGSISLATELEPFRWKSDGIREGTGDIE